MGDGRFVLSDASVLCSRADGESGEVVCAGAGTVPAERHPTSQYRHVHYYPDVVDAWEAEIDKHMESLGVRPDTAIFDWVAGASVLGLALVLVLVVVACAGLTSMKKRIRTDLGLGLELVVAP